MAISTKIFPFRYKGNLVAPASKSYLQRAIAIASLSEQPCLIQNYYPSNDAKAALSIARNLGAIITEGEHEILIQRGQECHKDVVLNCGESGLSTRMFSPIAALYNRKTTLIGGGSILQRPMHQVEAALRQFGIQTKSNSGFLPLEIQGVYKTFEAEIDGAESSQLLTGLLIALPTLNRSSNLIVKDLKSKPYVQMTLDILKHFGISIQHENFAVFHVSGNQTPKAKSYNVEGDWSGASFHLVGAAISGEISISELNAHSSQADRAILDALRICGAKVEIDEQRIKVSKNQLNSFEFDATHCPDLFPPLAVLAAACEGTSRIHGINRLVNKESNRAQTLKSEFSKLNIAVELIDDYMQISKSDVRGSTVNSCNDHRIAMACATLATLSDSAILIEQSEAINKSYPTYFEDLKQMTSAVLIKF